MTLTVAFGQMPFGVIFGTMFFVLLTVAAWTSAISLLEPITAYLVENRGLKRRLASLFAALAAWILGIAALLSFNELADFKPLGKTVFDSLEYVTFNIMLPLGGLLVAIFAGWGMRRESARSELALTDGRVFRIWRFLVRWVAPAAVIIVFLTKLGLLG